MISPDEEEELRGRDEDIKWLAVKAKEIAATLKKLDPRRINQIVKSYEKYLNHPAYMHVPLEYEEKEIEIDKERLKISFC